MILKLHHIGLVTSAMMESIDILKKMGFKEATHPYSDPIQKVEACFVNVVDGADVYVEFVQPVGEDSPVTGFLQKHNGGLHHLCFEVDDIESTAKEMEEKGFRMVSQPAVCTGFDKNFNLGVNLQSKVAFFMLPNKLLIELLEKGT
jgi:methylmalonyl-CoA/ethylmalonyl-CoA epimerase